MVEKLSTPQLLNVSTVQLLLGVRLCFGKTDDPAAVFPLAALFEQFDALETLQDVAFRDNSAGSSKTSMLGHKWEMSAQASAKLTIFKCQLRQDYNRLVRTTYEPEVAT